MEPQRVFSLIDFAAHYLPESVARSIFSAVGSVAGWSNLDGVRQLRANYQRVAPLPRTFAQRRRSAQAMRHYMRYYYEAFRLAHLTDEQVAARVSVENIETLQQTLRHSSCSAALMHMGNWDLAGAWATKNLAPVHTIAEKLQPAEIAQRFLDLRRDLGMVIYHAEKNARVIDALTIDMGNNRCFVPILCDRDLSASGVEVQLFGHAARVAPGPAILALRTGTPLFPVVNIADNFAHDTQRVRNAGTSWGIKVIIADPIYPGVDAHAPQAQRVADVQRMMDEWAEAISRIGRDHLTHWHMLQKVFVADLDPQRLARALKESL
ncbi:phosphatidylinositol mannoside acyltransferase [Arcanobacterium pinnipediorum]|uniref:Phosphatidylinositol mannoside acyltransferase n=1 Tax=Arcanobacterium pinnipediorum TaxID=1503041 RepID=A0ABY5AJJ3_9ACTO|nr:phosphatidylinositol mannoside acyltransferase [Arcanobacterium pinnipediorum]USR80155.1 phosphatidylinositol mannoside acyltransferase [Arcanobacterium pinnipediorum]